MKRGLWVRLDLQGEPPALRVQIGTGGAADICQVDLVSDDDWGPLWDEYVDARDHAARHPWVTLEGSAHAIHYPPARARLREARLALYQRLRQGILGAVGDSPLVSHRDPALAEMPLAPLFACAGSDSLPLDLHPRLPFAAAVALAADPGAWPRPTPAEVTVLCATDLGEGAALAAGRPAVGSPPAVRAQDLAPVLLWRRDLDAALRAAAAQGATVHRGLRADDVFSVAEGRFGPVVQLIAAVDVAAGEGPLLLCDDAALSLDHLGRALAGAAAGGWRSPLRALDLQTCVSSGPLSAAFHRAGVLHVTSTPDLLHPGRLCHRLRRFYEDRRLDGRTIFQHAWIRVGLGRPG